MKNAPTVMHIEATGRDNAQDLFVLAEIIVSALVQAHDVRPYRVSRRDSKDGSTSVDHRIDRAYV